MTKKVKSKSAVAIETLGCKLNQAESEKLAEGLAKAGYRLVSDIKEADIYILNTCTVTHIADRKSRQRLRMAQRQNPKILLAAIGCYAQRAGDELAEIGGVKLVLGNDEKMELPKLLKNITGATENEGLKQGHYYAFRSRAFIKAQDGCSNFCAYCIVPLVRKRQYSLPAEQIVAEIRQKVEAGYQEVVLTGTEIGSYSHNGLNLKDLLQKVLDETEIERLRLSSLQPNHITSGLIGLWQNPRLCRHFHLSLQSGSDAVLQGMRRRYSVKDYEKALSLIRSQLPDAALTTDIIVGFPGENEAEFEESHDFCRKAGFARIHVFSYSVRPGTAAAGMPAQVSSEVKKQRSRKMLALAEESAEGFRRRFLGRTMTVLWEQKKRNIWEGLTGNYIRVYTRTKEDLTSRITEVNLKELYKDGVWGKI